MRVLMVAPFERGRGHGGSQRATAIAERLEDRGLEVGWQVVSSRATTYAEKLRSLIRAHPSIVGLYEHLEELPGGAWDAMIVAHSYLVPSVAGHTGVLPAIVDFHNLEWLHLADAGRNGSGALIRPNVRALYRTSQVRLMRRLERSIIRQAPLSLFVSDRELAWATKVAPSSGASLVPSVLPRSEYATATAIHSSRAPEEGHLVYVGTLTFPTNLISLRGFLAEHWPAMLASEPRLRLTIVGACSDQDRVALEAHPRVQAVGFVEDLAPVLVGCEAVVMPFTGVAGTSLRALFYALAGLTVIGPSEAFRGIPFGMGIAVRSSSEWAQAAQQSVNEPRRQVASVRQAHQRATAHQNDTGPWDRLAQAIGELARLSRTVAGPRLGMSAVQP